MKHKIFCLMLLLSITFALAATDKQPKKIVSFLKSALIPGWGELSQNHKSAYVFFTSEASLILSYKYFELQSDNKINQSLLYACKKAHIPYKIKDENLRLIVGKYNSSGYNSGGYNESIVKAAMSLYPDNPDAQTNYISANILPEDIYWAWDSVADQNRYRIMRKDSNEFKDLAKAVSGAIIANHIASAFNAARVTKKNKADIGIGFNHELKPLLTCNYKF